MLAGASWRSAWLAFAALAVLATLWAAFVLPARGGRPDAPADDARYGWGAVLCRRALPLLAGGVVVGLGSSVYWTFAVEHLTGAGALSPTASRTFLGIVGVASVLATLTADFVRRAGPRRAFVTTTAAEASALALLALVPFSLAAGIASAILFGAAYNATLAIEALWSTRVFADRPSLGISAVMASNGVGFLLGPLGAGLLAGPFGLGPALLAGAVMVAAAGLLAPREPILPEVATRAARPARGCGPRPPRSATGR